MLRIALHAEKLLIGDFHVEVPESGEKEKK
jgi:hypothetical protein